MANFKPLSIRFCAQIPNEVSQTETCLVLGLQATAKICNTLGSECYTRLLVDVGTETEVVKVTCDANGNLKIERGQDNTKACVWPVGSLLYFDWTSENMVDWIECQTPVTEEEAPIKIPGYTAELNEDGVWCYELEDANGTEGKSWFGKGQKFTIKNGEITCEASDENNLPDGSYQNATVTIRDGCIVAVAKGCNIISQACAPSCSCAKCTGSIGTSIKNQIPCSDTELPTDGCEGCIYFNTTTNCLNFLIGTTWVGI